MSWMPDVADEPSRRAAAYHGNMISVWRTTWTHAFETHGWHECPITPRYDVQLVYAM